MPPEAGVLHQIDGELAFELSANGDLTIGRDASNDLVLDDAGVSRAHSRMMAMMRPWRAPRDRSACSSTAARVSSASSYRSSPR